MARGAKKRVTNRITRAMDEQGMTYEALADAIGYESSWVQRKIKDPLSAKIEFAVAVMQVLNIPLYEIYEYFVEEQVNNYN